MVCLAPPRKSSQGDGYPRVYFSVGVGVEKKIGIEILEEITEYEARA